MLETTATPRNASLHPPLDTRYQVETPEGIDLPLRPAGLLVRTLAFALDLGIRGLVLGLLFIVLGFFGEIGIDLFEPGLDPARQQWFYREQLKVARDFGLGLVETRPGLSPDSIEARAAAELLRHEIKVYVGSSVEVSLQPEGGVERSQGKAKRVVDLRPK